MDYPWYVITGDINVENFTNLYTQERGFIWRGFTHDCEMVPPAANYNESGKKITCCRTGSCHPQEEIKRIAEKIHELNKLQKFPFEMPPLIRAVLFSGFYQPEEDLFKQMGIKEFPDSTLAQAMALVQHESGGTSLLDFSTSKNKALYFAIGRENLLDTDSSIFGLNVPWFETHKEHLAEEVFKAYGTKFDLLYPSYFKNDNITHQEGAFLYQKFEIVEGRIQNGKYENILKFFEKHYDYYNANIKDNFFEKINIDDFLKITEFEEKRIFYIHLRVPAKEKRPLKLYLNSIGITDAFMMN